MVLRRQDVVVAEPLGMGLQGLLWKRRDLLTGILNGIDTAAAKAAPGVLAVFVGAGVTAAIIAVFLVAWGGIRMWSKG